MKEKELTERDYSEIFSGAHNNWIDKATRGSSYFHVRCIVDSFLAYTKKYNLVVQDGKLLEKDNEQNKR